MNLTSNPAAARRRRTWWRTRGLLRWRRGVPPARSPHLDGEPTAGEGDNAARHQRAAGAKAALHDRVHTGLEVVAHHQDEIDRQLQVLHQQLGLLREYSDIITIEIAHLEQRWSELEDARTKLVIAERRLENERSFAVHDAT